jgi:hypothetical protein
MTSFVIFQIFNHSLPSLSLHQVQIFYLKLFGINLIFIKYNKRDYKTSKRLIISHFKLCFWFY